MILLNDRLSLTPTLYMKKLRSKQNNDIICSFPNVQIIKYYIKWIHVKGCTVAQWLAWPQQDGHVFDIYIYIMNCLKIKRFHLL